MRYTTATFLAVFLVVCAFGQPEVKTKAKLPRFWSKLGLSEEQRKTVVGIQAKYKVKIEALRQQIADLEKEEKAELGKVLTEAQRAELLKLVASQALAESPAKESPKNDGEK